MDTDKLNRWLTFGANLAVLAGIIFLAAEINQNTDMMRTQINQSRAEASMNEAAAMYNSGYIPEILVKLQQGDEITPVEHERYVHFLRGLHRNFDNQLRQYRDGFLDHDIPRSVRGAIEREVVAIQIARLEWERTRQTYSDAYITFVDGILAEHAE